MSTEVIFPTLNESLNKEHKEILFLLTQIRYDKSNLGKIYELLLDYVTEHFDHEEKFMRSLNYPYSLYSSHESAHEELRDFFLNRFRLSPDTPEANERIIEASRILLLSHLGSYDTTLANWYASHNNSNIVEL